MPPQRAPLSDFGKIAWVRAQNTGGSAVPPYGAVQGTANNDGSYTVQQPTGNSADSIFFADDIGIPQGGWGKITRHSPFPAACDSSVNASGVRCGVKAGSYLLWSTGSSGAGTGFVAHSGLTNGLAMVARVGGAITISNDGGSVIVGGATKVIFKPGDLVTVTDNHDGSATVQLIETTLAGVMVSGTFQLTCNANGTATVSGPTVTLKGCFTVTGP